ncbi:MAG TPA: YciI family protein [Candidatus Saccharimonadales bacterium]|jgi:hypothetical protein|nr:YciI family protein [Candidatus Saccharimonadales bacterium]
MNKSSPSSEYLVLSRGQWDHHATKEDIQAAIDRFYVWLDQAVQAGKMKGGSRLTTARAVVSKSGVITDGPFNEAKEIVGGYWFIVAGSLAEAAAIATENPCLQYGLQLEIRPLEPERGSAYRITNETPTTPRAARSPSRRTAAR